MKWIDIPPVWLALCLVLTWLSGALWQAGHPLLSVVGTGLVVLGLALMVAAVWEMARRRTTPIPHMQPSALVSSGVFGLSRNPIYLGDALVLIGLALRWHAPLGLLLVPLFVWVIHRRFIFAEEARLSAAFGAEFDAYRRRTRRWI